MSFLEANHENFCWPDDHDTTADAIFVEKQIFNLFTMLKNIFIT